MKVLSSILILAAMGTIVAKDFQPSSISAVSLIGGVIRARHIAEEQDTKYPRDECPVCEGKGWYQSGDGIEKVPCGYCEPVKKEPTLDPAYEPDRNTDPPLVPVKPDTFYLRK
jgi:hypothetical protein